MGFINIVFSVLKFTMLILSFYLLFNEHNEHKKRNENIKKLAAYNSELESFLLSLDEQVILDLCRLKTQKVLTRVSQV